MLRISLIAALCFSLSSIANSADWPGFRGPHQNGITKDSAPTKWDADENILWKVPLPHPGNGSPIVVDRKVLLNSTEDAE